jgi:hypothetical protein
LDHLVVAAEYRFGAPGVGTLFLTCAPLGCARAKAVTRLMPLRETRAPGRMRRLDRLELSQKESH